jgi:chromate transporter
MMIWNLFLSFLQVGFFSVGGGYAAIPIIQSLVVGHYGWLSPEEFTDLIAIAEMTPGPIAVNSATFVGLRLAGFGGALIATLGCILPSLITVSILSWIYTHYRKANSLQIVLDSLRPTVVALIASAAVTMFFAVAFPAVQITLNSVNWVGVLLTISALIALRKLHIGPIPVMLGCGTAALIIRLIISVFE